MNFSTPVDIPSSPYRITYDDQVLCLGSCFAQNMGDKLHEWGFKVAVNPFGALYNPLSILSVSQRLSCPAQPAFERSALVEHNGLFHSMLHSQAFSFADPEQTLKAINLSLRQGQQAWAESSVLLVSLGSAFVYEYDGKVVSNCHKIPDKQFNRRRLSVTQTTTALKQLLSLTSSFRLVVLTVSPIRHLRDGLHENNLSKSTLLLAIDQLLHNDNEQEALSQPDKATHNNKTEANNVMYFPSYEILMDELRDYRFYASDMLHPSSVAEDYIWERFTQSCLSPDLSEQMRERHRLFLASQHRPLSGIADS